MISIERWIASNACSPPSLLKKQTRSSDRSRKCCAYASRNRPARKRAKPPSCPLKSPELLLDGIRDGIQSLVWELDTFAYADGWDEIGQRYLGLKAGQKMNPVLNALLVKSEAAAAQIAAEAARLAV